MIPAASESKSDSEALIVSLDVGTSSVRSLLFDNLGTQQDGFGEQLPYNIITTPDGGVEADPKTLLDLSTQCLSRIQEQLGAVGKRPAAVAFSAFWHSFLGVDDHGDPCTRILHLFDTRSGEAVRRLETMLDGQAVHQRTGCRLHTSYWPSKLLWLSECQPAAFAQAKRWMSFGEFLFLKLFGVPMMSVSMASGTGLWNQRENRYDTEMLAALPVRIDQLWPAEEADQPQTKLMEPYHSKWPALDGIPWYPAIGDGACSNIGSGCSTREDFALMVGTSGAMRAVLPEIPGAIPDGLWCYRVDRKRYIAGGALSNGGEVYAWMKRTLALPGDEEIEQALAEAKPGEHQLTVLPFFAGERSPYWRSDLRGAITGLNLASRPIDILQASLEAVSLRFAEIFQAMRDSFGCPKRVVASGGALLHSRAWTQMMADAVDFPVIASEEAEASSRGAALLALERLGAIPDVSAVPSGFGETYRQRPKFSAIYRDLLAAQHRLYQKLFVEN